MTTNRLPVWPALSASEFADAKAGRKGRAMAAYRKRVTVQLRNGGWVVPGLRGARAVVEHAMSEIADISLMIEESHFLTFAEHAARLAEVDLKRRIFECEMAANEVTGSTQSTTTGAATSAGLRGSS